MAESLADGLAFLAECVAPKAMSMDADPDALRAAYEEMGKRRLGALKIPVNLGGSGLSEPDFRSWQREAARASGTFAFLQTQHQSAASLIWKSASPETAQEILLKMATLERGIGIGFSQLRRPGPPLLRATPDGDQVRLDGHIPWITGHNFFGEVLVGATLPDGRAAFGLIPFRTEPGLKFSSPMRLAAMEAAQTVTADLEGFPMTTLFVKPNDWILKNDQLNVVLQGHFAIGCARAGLDVLASNAEKKPLPFLKEALALLIEELDECEAAMATLATDLDAETSEERLQVRAWAIDLALRCAHAGVVSSSGAANSVNHPAQRIYREALVFTVSAQTIEIMRASLERLTAPRLSGAMPSRKLVP